MRFTRKSREVRPIFAEIRNLFEASGNLSRGRHEI
jgi:hypothetical protein